MPQIEAILVDCHDPERLARFWSELLERPIEGRRGPYVWIRVSDDMTLGMQRVTADKHGKNRVHFDIAAEDVAATEQRVLELGGARATGYEDGGFLVMTDPEGNEFCVLPATPFETDEDGRAHYLD